MYVFFIGFSEKLESPAAEFKLLNIIEFTGLPN